MNPDSSRPPEAASLIVLVIFLVTGGLAWWLHFRPQEEVDPTSIVGIPLEIEGWRGEDIPIEESVERLLRADSQIQRSYRNTQGELVWLYIGYYGTGRGGRPEHTPWECYPSAGWLILSALEMDFGEAVGVGDPGQLNELVVEQDGLRRLVYFWYATHRSTAIASQAALTLDHMFGRFSRAGRADGALVRVSTPIAEGGIVAARDRLRRFSKPLNEEIRVRWPDTL